MFLIEAFFFNLNMFIHKKEVFSHRSEEIFGFCFMTGTWKLPHRHETHTTRTTSLQITLIFWGCQKQKRFHSNYIRPTQSSYKQWQKFVYLFWSRCSFFLNLGLAASRQKIFHLVCKDLEGFKGTPWDIFSF